MPALVIALLVAATTWAAPAGAAARAVVERPSERCSELWNAGDGVVADVPVEGDLVVDSPAAGCTLRRVHVLGDLVVPAGTRVTGELVRVDGHVRAAGSVTLSGTDREQSTVWNDVELDGGPDARVVLDRTTLLGDVSGRTGDVLLTGAKVVGTWDVAVDHVTRIRAATWVSAPATVRGGRVLIHDARFSEGLTLDGTGDALVCRTRIGLDLLVTHLTDYARIGLEVPYACLSLIHIPSPRDISGSRMPSSA